MNRKSLWMFLIVMGKLNYCKLDYNLKVLGKFYIKI